MGHNVGQNPSPGKQDRKAPRRYRLFGRLRARVAGYIDRLFGGGFERMDFGFERNRGFDLEVRSDEIVVTAEVAGFAADEIDVERRDKTLTIRGVKRHARKTGKSRQSKRQPGSDFKHSMLLPEAADGQSIETNFRNGVLKVHVPRSHTAHAKNAI
jgi:HSP20 family molecular chaperone IbpA